MRMFNATSVITKVVVNAIYISFFVFKKIRYQGLVMRVTSLAIYLLFSIQLCMCIFRQEL